MMENKKIETEKIGISAPLPAQASGNNPKFGSRLIFPAINFAKKNFALVSIALVAIVWLSGALKAGMFGWIIPDIFFPDIWNFQSNTGAIFRPDKYGWIVASVMGLVLGTIFGSLGYILSGILGQRVMAWSKTRMADVAESAIILVFVSAAFYTIYDKDIGPLMMGGFFQIDNAIHFAETIRNTILLEFVTMTTVTAFLSMVGNLTPYFRPAGIIGISFSLSPAFRPIFDSLGIMLSSLSVAVGVWYLQLWFLIFVQTRLMGFFMPVGMFLRAVNLERVGNVLIAIAIGFYFIYPFVLNVSAMTLQNYLAAQYGDPKVYTTQGPNGTSGVQTWASLSECYDHTSKGGQGAQCFFKLSTTGVWTYIKEYITNAGFGSLAVFGLVQLLTGSLPASITVSLVVMFTLSLLTTTLFYVLIVSILMPLFNIFITLTVIKEITKILGTEIDLSAFEKLF